jgi:hypothetical protein
MLQRKVYLSYDIISGHNAKVIKRKKTKGKKLKVLLKIKEKRGKEKDKKGKCVILVFE